MVRLNLETKLSFKKVIPIILIILLIFSQQDFAEPVSKDRIYDYAGLLTSMEKANLNKKLDKYSKRRKTDIVIVTYDEVYASGHRKFNEDFYDKENLGYKDTDGSTVLLSINMASRDVSVLGFSKGEKYVDNDRAYKIRRYITDDLSAGNYNKAFNDFSDRSYRYLGIRPGVNPDSIFFSNIFIGSLSLMIGLVYIAFNLRRAGGSMTVDDRTYRDFENTKIIDKKDRYIRTSVARTKIESNNSSGGSGGSSGGGRTSGGSSYSGSSGKF